MENDVPIVKNTTKKLKVNCDQSHSSVNDDDTTLKDSTEVKLHFCEQSTTPKSENECEKSRSPIEIFPEELWELILHQLKNSQDILNVLRAFPQLDLIFHNKKALWLFDLVLPQMTKYLIIKTYNQTENYKYTKPQDLLNLRLVSKRWKNAVNNLIFNHPDNHPPSSTEFSDNLQDGTSGKLIQPFFTQNHFNYTRLFGYHFGATVFRTPYQIDRFLEEMLNHSGNPFAGKSVFVKPYNEEASTSHNLVEKCVNLFEQFGHHVLNLEMHFWDRDSDCHFTLCKNILKCLASLPNLRSLTFQGELDTYSYVFTNYYFEDPKTQKYFPELPNLESFSWKVRFTYQYESSWITRMLKTYGNVPGLRKLEIAENNWNTIDPDLPIDKLPNLTDLHLLLDTNYDTGLEEVEYLFRDLKKENLKKFTLSQTPPPLQNQPANFQRHQINITELLLNLSDYQVENLILENLRLTEKPVEQEMKFVSSVTSLYIEDNLGLSYEFLRWLPNLKNLTIFYKYDTNTLFRPNREDRENEIDNWLAKNLRGMVLKAYNKNYKIPNDFLIWKAFPKLEMITGLVVAIGDENEEDDEDNDNIPVLDIQFVREYGNKAFYSNRPTGFDDDVI